VTKPASRKSGSARKAKALSDHKLVKVRLVFEDAESRAAIGDWVNWILQSGVEVLSSNKRSIDIQGDEKRLEAALATTIVWDAQDLPKIGEVTRTLGRGGAAPTAYVPQSPTYFP
jgi:hypothetical protein